MTFVETDQLSKSFGSFAALSSCSLTIEKGTIFGLLGPNGAGKSTLIRLLMGFLTPTEGRALINGFNCHQQSLAVRQVTSYLPGDARLDRQYRGRTILKLFTALRVDGCLAKALEIAEFLELDVRRKVGSMSTGMRQKLAVTIALANEAPFIIMDEPTANLDPTVRQQILGLLRLKREEGKTILFSSHILDEVEAISDTVGFLKQGKLITTAEIKTLRNNHRLTGSIEQTLPSIPTSLSDEIQLVKQTGNKIILEVKGNLLKSLEWLKQSNLSDITIEPARLRSLYEEIHPERSELKP
ncbi:MAG: ABC transporter ATP-binding protein [Pirellulales bacterium]|jgi:ABC-2 type transport system ATP-binding protein|nr:multidrug ABC transporter ATP-binding protein [Rhodopirellula sp.]MCH2369551.1 ABC transporter ATP-binding protein [Pirellulales bacterium]|tara:strand:+ start:225 stop:1118 length:894 start_codon:yes stop_codon:yes gene_type:complete